MDSSEDDDSYPSVTSHNRKYSRESEEEEQQQKEEETASPLQSRLYLAGLGIFCILVAGTAVYICKPCTGEWIFFKKKCYMFSDKPAPWKTWEQSRTICKERGADLVVIDDLEEQEFVSKHIKYYHSKQHGYWMGLQNVNNSWTWVTGRVDTLGFWMKDMEIQGPKVMVLPRLNPSESWKTAENGFQNKFVCEQNARLRSN